ncbi:HAMP domain-containing methyl-accepting chemotaxis protein [Novosphingobium sp. APW14]|uniref:methyl-accepting chemotaxis protein n=1 Tax=Novosphingobium sp. APW14 TaxID=3077237 RepID=UPI0028E05412|nr:HAMP domain-containing methyl-accepting chemotaxis protein [Novosphingobium sp. APW14]MDT9013969.1 HAMP domain-containing methyl-accepting chemotaxis protein [Novosphingobium sp. APW14]
MSKSIKQKTRIGGIAIVGALAVTLVATGVGLNRIRLGGSLDYQNGVTNNFVADILPPALYLVEPMLQATWIASDPEEAEEHSQVLRKLQAEHDKRLEFWKQSDLDPELREFVETKISADAEQFWKQVNEEMIPAGRSGDPARINQAHDKLESLYEQHRADIDQLVLITDRYNKQLYASSTSSSWIVIALLAAMGMALLAAIMWGMRLLNRLAIDPLAQTAQTMTAMAAGNLDAGITHDHRLDEIGEMTRSIEVFRAASRAQRESAAKQEEVVNTLTKGLEQLAEGNLAFRLQTPLAEQYESLRNTFNASLSHLSSIIESVVATARSVSTGASEIRAASDDLAVRNEQQAASIEETSAAMNSVTQSIAATADNAGEVRRSIDDAHREASEGGQVVERAIDAMAQIEQSSQEIAQIIGVIDGIAFQTNLLALNAGVEAARAGDAGKGFAVVANEVRALAQRSADAAHDIKELIGTSSKQVEGGVALVGEAGTLLQTIVSRVGEISKLVQGIAEGARAQATTVQQVNSAVGDMDRMTQQNAAMVEESTAAARSLANEAGELSKLVAQFSTESKSMQMASSAEPVALPPRAVRRRVAAQPVIQGNLAVATSTAGDDDWSEF